LDIREVDNLEQENFKDNSEKEYIKLVTSSPELKDKIHVDVKSSTDTIYWHIKFNIPLDESSVSEKTAGVTDTQGYILNTKIRYSQKSNLISIQPLEPYVQNEYYIMSIYKDVRSANLQNLKRDIHILFKLKNNDISEYKILPPNVSVPEPRKRPKTFNHKPTKSRVYSFDKYKDGEKNENLPSASIMINPIIGAVGIIAAAGSIIMNNGVFIAISSVIAVVGVMHIVKQLTDKKFRSNFTYNRGARCFKKENYYKADSLFSKALELNPENEYAEYAKNKVSYYL